MLNLKGKNIFISGGSGYLGKNLAKYFMNTDVNKVVIFSRDESKQFYMRKELDPEQDKLRFIIGDVRDLERLEEACQNMDYIIHTAALKQVPIIEYNPFEAVLTNIIGTMNVIKAACSNYVEKIIYISSDKANMPVNLYGATKFCAEKLIQQGFVYSRNYDVKLISVRYGNVAGSTGSVIPSFRKLINEGEKILPLTDIKMSRFWFDVQGAIDLILLALENGGKDDIFVPKLKSFYILHLIEALNCKYKIIGNRGAEKLSEQMINKFENYKEFEDYYIINPKYNNMGFTYDCANNEFMTIEEIKEKLRNIK